jgi:hypothetical protein
LFEKSGEDGSLGAAPGNIPDKEDLLFVRLLRLVVVGLLLRVDMVAVVSLMDWAE